MTVITQSDINRNNLNQDAIKQNDTNQAMPVPDDADIIVECNALDESIFENIFTHILQLQMKHNKNCVICFDIKTEPEGKRSIMMGNRLGIPVIVRIADRRLFNDLFQFWLEWKQATIPVYPFSTIVQIYAARLLNRDFNPFIDAFFRHSNVDQAFVNDAMEYLHKSNVLADCLKLVSGMFDWKCNAKRS